ncbi:Uncharacterised protein [Leclercia adecarboxylata]|uniref:Uncharacterized protein n=1 Tax=Leclercia adecarboxylata TaxID=83655 RepID=A0A4U9HMA9_9ENTR|nr:Uncharacterised protein [Leclercia adecarboxylata]
MAKTIAIAINLFNPQKVVIGGRKLPKPKKVLLPAIEGWHQYAGAEGRFARILAGGSLRAERSGSAIGAFALVKRAMLNGILLQAFCWKADSGFIVSPLLFLMPGKSMTH